MTHSYRWYSAPWLRVVVTGVNRLPSLTEQLELRLPGSWSDLDLSKDSGPQMGKLTGSLMLDYFTATEAGAVDCRYVYRACSPWEAGVPIDVLLEDLQQGRGPAALLEWIEAHQVPLEAPRLVPIQHARPLEVGETLWGIQHGYGIWCYRGASEFTVGLHVLGQSHHCTGQTPQDVVLAAQGILDDLQAYHRAEAMTWLARHKSAASPMGYLVRLRKWQDALQPFLEWAEKTS